jgi:hypothetical protein
MILCEGGEVLHIFLVIADVVSQEHLSFFLT